MKKKTRKILTKIELDSILEEWSDKETHIGGIVIIPPDSAVISDEEDFDDHKLKPINVF